MLELLNNFMNSYKHSGAFGDLIYGLSVVKHLGPGKFYLHLDQMNWVGTFYYGYLPDQYHQGRLNQADYEFIRPLMEAQDYITEFLVLDNTAEITHNLDNFRPLFKKHNENYLDTYCTTFGIMDSELRNTIQNTAWLTVPEPLYVEGRDIAVNRSTRWVQPIPPFGYSRMKAKGWMDRAFFLGLPLEYDIFKQKTGWNIPYQPVSNMLEMAQYIKGAEQFIGNQSLGLALAVALNEPLIHVEQRVDMPLEINECYFPHNIKLHYF